MAKIAKKFVKNSQKMQKNAKKFVEKILKFLTHFTRGGSPPRKYTFFDPSKKYKSIFMVSITKKKVYYFNNS